MRAVLLDRYGSPDDLRVGETDRPDPGEGEVLVGVHAASVNDWDWGLIRGSPFYIRSFTGLRTPRLRIPGVDVAGVVEAIGPGVTRWTPGDRVFGDLSGSGLGGFAEFVCAPESSLARIPDGVGDERAAALPHAAALALQGLRDSAGLSPGQRLLVNGAGGGVGTLAVQMAAIFGVSGVTGVDAAHKHGAMREAGYEHVIDYRETDFTSTGERYDVILDTRSNRGPWRYGRALRPGGIYVTVGGRTRRLLENFLLGPVVGRLSGGRRFRVLALDDNKDLGEIAAWCAEGRLEPVIDRVVPLEETPAAIRRFGEAAHIGKIIVTTGGG